ncbi:MAG: type II toxin-antitoxin system RelE/ParE family toxin [Cyanobacteria bacterium]|nr:type II toxin-antitoxin system RelE/ParE family toxin [Cyanobacteriota bacterium]
MEYEIQFSPLAMEMLMEVRDKRELEKLRDRINQLKLEPDKQGKVLTDNLAGLRSVRAVGQRYRIVYEIEEETIVVLVIGVGRRKEGDKRDIYRLLGKLLQDE